MQWKRARDEMPPLDLGFVLVWRPGMAYPTLGATELLHVAARSSVSQTREQIEGENGYWWCLWPTVPRFEWVDIGNVKFYEDC